MMGSPEIELIDGSNKTRTQVHIKGSMPKLGNLYIKVGSHSMPNQTSILACFQRIII